MNRIRFSCFALLAAAAVACNKDDIITREEAQAPVIAFDVNTGVYTAKVGREFTIAPTYEYVDRAVYAWKLEKTGRIISTEPVLTYVIDEVEGEEKEDYYIELEVTTPQGTTREQTRVEVYRILPPVIVLSEGAEVVRGHVYEISPDVRWGEKATYRWTMRRPGAAEVEEVGREPTYEFCEQALGEYELRLRAENEDGADEKSIRVEVTEALPVSVTVPPIGRLYDGLTRTVPLGRSITASLDLERPESPLQLDGRRRGDLDGTRLHLYALRQRSEETAFHGDGQLGRTCGGGGERGEVDRRGACDGGVQRRMLRRRGGFPASGHAVQRSDVDEGLRIYAGARPVHQ